MSDLNRANRQCCDLDIREYATKKPFLFADWCNTTTAGFTSAVVYATSKGAKKIKYDDALEGTMTCEFQLHPFKVYALLSDGVIDTTAVVAERKRVKCTVAGSLTLTDTPVPNTVFVFAKGDIGGTPIKGTFTTGTFTATTPGDIAKDSEYEVTYLVSKVSGVKKVSFNNKKAPKDFYITQETIDKDEQGNLIPIKIIAYKATPQRSLNLSFSSTGDPASITMTFDLLEDEQGNVIDIVEITE